MRDRRGARAIFFVDDNITLDVARFKALCQAIIDAGLNDVDYMVQGMTSPIAAHGAELAPLMRRAGFRYVFLGIENILDDDLGFLKAAREEQPARARTARGQRLHGRGRRPRRHGMFVIGGLIVGNPDDTRGGDRSQPGVRAEGTWTGRTSSIRRRTRARR